jgi:hypothetical protein
MNPARFFFPKRNSMETFNKFAVGVAGRDVVIVVPPRRLSPADAMLFAAWLVTMAQIQDSKLEPFDTYLKAVRSS